MKRNQGEINLIRLPYTAVREQLDPTKKVVFQAIQMALIAALNEVQQQQKKCLLNFGQNLPVNLQGHP